MVLSRISESKKKLTYICMHLIYARDCSIQSMIFSMNLKCSDYHFMSYVTKLKLQVVRYPGAHN